MNWLDIIFLCLAGAGLLKGLFDGMVKQVVALGAFIIGIYLCTGVADWFGGYLKRVEWFPEEIVVYVSYFLGFILIAGVVLLAGRVIHSLVSSTPLSILNHLAGGILGVLLMVLCISFLINIIELFDSKSILLSQEMKVESRFYLKLKDVIPTVFPGNPF